MLNSDPYNEDTG